MPKSNDIKKIPPNMKGAIKKGDKKGKKGGRY